MKLIAVIAILLLTGCAWFGRGPKLKIGNAEVTAPKDVGKAATLTKAEAGTTVPLPAGSTVTVTKIDAVPAVAAQNGQPAVKAEPAREVTVIAPNGPTEYVKTEVTTKADSGTVDTSVAARRIDAEESRPLLYGAIVAALAGAVFIYLHYPTPAICCFGAAVVFFMAWKLSGLPAWFWALGLVAIAGGVALYFGHERGLYTPVPDDKK